MIEDKIPVPEFSFAFLIPLLVLSISIAILLTRRSKLLIPAFMLGLICIAPVTAMTPAFEDEFSSLDLSIWKTRAKYELTSGELVLNSGTIESVAMYQANKTLMSNATFSSLAGKSRLGFTDSSYGAYFHQIKGALWCYTWDTGGSRERTKLAVAFDYEREYEIRWSTGFVTFLIDDEVVAHHESTVPKRRPFSIGFFASSEAQIRVDSVRLYEGAEETPEAEETGVPIVYETFDDGIDVWKWGTNAESSIWSVRDGVVKVTQGDMISVDAWVPTSTVNLTMRIAAGEVPVNATLYEKNEFWGFISMKGIQFVPANQRLEVKDKGAVIGCAVFITEWDRTLKRTAIYTWTGKLDGYGTLVWKLKTGPYFVDNIEDFHVYTILWEKNYIEYRIDGNTIFYHYSTKIIPEKPCNIIYGSRNVAWIKADWIDISVAED